jgi:DNA-binding GntR family transcriptional regulator
MPLTVMTERPGRVTDAVRRTLREAILSGDPGPGEQLSVPDLARRLGVSRGSVREAVLQLVADGLAEERPRRGVAVVALSHEEMRQIHQIREALEGQAAHLCAARPEPDLVVTLEGVLGEQEKAVAAADGGGYADTDSRFHAELARACGNPMLTAMIERLHDQMRVALAVVAEAPEHRRRGHEELGQVLDAVRNADPEAAEAAMRAHIRRTRSELDAHHGGAS